MVVSCVARPGRGRLCVHECVRVLPIRAQLLPTMRPATHLTQPDLTLRRTS